MACPQCGRRLRRAAPAPPAAPAGDAAPVVDLSRRRRSAAQSRLPLLLGAGAGALVLAAAAVGAFLMWGPMSGGAAPPPPSTPNEPVAQAPPAAPKPDKTETPEPKKPTTSEKPQVKTEPAHPAPPAPPPAPTMPEAWKEIALAESAPDLDAKVVEKVNAVRKAAGLAPVAPDAAACAGCAAHARCLARNAGRIAALALDVHGEDAALPGRSDAGGRAAGTAAVVWKEPLAALDAWAEAPAHRALLLQPDLKAVGFGFAHNAKDQWASVFDWSGAAAADGAVLYPVGGQTDVPLYFPGEEVPDPIPELKEKARPSGFPVTVTFPPAARVKLAGAYLEDEAGAPVEAWVSSPEKPANERFPDVQRNTVCLIAKSPLSPGVRYTVLVNAEVNRQPWSRAWSFLTAGPDDLRGGFEDRFLKRINAARSQAGLQPIVLDPVPSLACAAHARYLALNVPGSPALDSRDETAGLPGYTEEGKKVAARSISRLRGGTAENEVDMLLGLLGTRQLLLEPSLQQIALGSAYIGSNAGVWVLQPPADVMWAERHEPILYPADGQKGVGLAYGPELPSAVPPDGMGKPAGFPVTVRFPWHKPLENVTGRLEDGQGREVPTWLSTPQQPLRGVAPFVVCVLPREPLHEGETYTAAVTADFDGKAWNKTWKFTTKKRDDIDADAVGAKVLARVNEVRKLAGLKPVETDAALSRGCQLHARYLVLNQGKPALEGLGAHREDKGLPGATPEGAKAGAGAVIDVVAEPADAVDGWMKTFFHRIPILAPDLRRIGFGCAQTPDDMWVCVMDVQAGK